MIRSDQLLLLGNSDRLQAGTDFADQSDRDIFRQGFGATDGAVSNLIREGKVHQIMSSMQTGKAAGNRLLNDSLAELVTRGVVEYEEALSKAADKTELARRLGRPAV